MNRKKLNVVVLQGGFEPECFASRLNAKTIYEALLSAGYENVKLVDVDENIIPVLCELSPEFAFISLFCKWGEDGVIQSLLEILKIPYSGSGIEASSLCNNKYLFSMFAKGIGIHVPETKLYSSKDEVKNTLLKYPCVVKPLYQGNSVGISFVDNENQFSEAVDTAFLHGTSIIVQEFIKGREFTVGVIDVPNEDTRVLPIIEIKLGRSIQDNEIKEKDMLIEEIVPAQISKCEKKELESASLLLHQKSGCLGVSRFDVRQNKHGKFFFLENNTCPAVMDLATNDLPRQLTAANISIEKYVDYMIIAGLDRKSAKIDYSYFNNSKGDV